MTIFPWRNFGDFLRRFRHPSHIWIEYEPKKIVYVHISIDLWLVRICCAATFWCFTDQMHFRCLCRTELEKTKRLIFDFHTLYPHTMIHAHQHDQCVHSWSWEYETVIQVTWTFGGSLDSWSWEHFTVHHNFIRNCAGD